MIEYNYGTKKSSSEVITELLTLAPLGGGGQRASPVVFRK